MFLVNELVLDDKIRKQLMKSELDAASIRGSGNETNKPTTEFWTVTIVKLASADLPDPPSALRQQRR
jgi:hypothetical protein